jgi:hypothetical protein
VPRSRQGHPVILQAGMSGRGMAFAARWAELVFAAYPNLEAGRKQPLRMMGNLGLGFALRYRFGRLGLHDAIARLERLSGARIGSVELANGRAAIDVDKPADLVLVRRLAGGPVA